jgi:hypothetical protein
VFDGIYVQLKPIAHVRLLVDGSQMVAQGVFGYEEPLRKRFIQNTASSQLLASPTTSILGFAQFLKKKTRRSGLMHQCIDNAHLTKHCDVI